MAASAESEEEGCCSSSEEQALLPQGRNMVEQHREASVVATRGLLRSAAPGALLCCVAACCALHRFGLGTRGAVASGYADGAGGRGPEPAHGTLLSADSSRDAVTLIGAGASVLPQPEGKDCSDALPGDKCYDSVTWAMQEGIWGHPEWYPGLNLWSRFEEFQEELHKQGKCPQPCRDPGTAERHNGIPGRALDLPGLWGARKELTFYMYRAMGDVVDYPLANVNAADLAGVMWYLHNEIVPSMAVTRKYNITRIWRFKVTMKTTWEFFNVHRRQFGGFVAFDNGRCTVPHCDKIWKHFGFIPGCQFQSMDPGKDDSFAYFSMTKTRMEGCHNHMEPYCNNSVWYSLPGPCPGKDIDTEGKDEECVLHMPGGLCDKATGEKNCTYSYETAGYIELDELVGIRNYHAFFKKGYREYSHHIDAGVGCTFWNGRNDGKLCQERMDKVKSLFKEKYPDLPACDELPPPPCDFDGWYTDSTGVKEFDWESVHSPIEPTGLTKAHM